MDAPYRDAPILLLIDKFFALDFALSVSFVRKPTHLQYVHDYHIFIGSACTTQDLMQVLDHTQDIIEYYFSSSFDLHWWHSSNSCVCNWCSAPWNSRPSHDSLFTYFLY
eukprot:GHVR01053759.1.p1 GENE.GHVR01053759.1~~GHVR01053759.1.p1  ORF type:complete len:109 (-),score=3.26 GHVR01053759.1:34-360(-)